jgi:anti-sigma factor (TIGR02949 family)
MSCGNHHDVECASIMASLDAFIDGEDTELDRAKIQQHLQECGPCLQEEQVDKIIKARVAKACRDEICSEQVRTRILHRLSEIRVDTMSEGTATTMAAIATLD